MYTINKNIVDKILRRKFIALVGGLCERLENLDKLKLDNENLIDSIKFEIKKNSYDTMREIKEQISSFSEGTTVSVDFRKLTK